jgi:hypothetical protein
MILKFVLHFLDAQGPNWAQRGRYGPVRELKNFLLLYIHKTEDCVTYQSFYH